MSYTSSERRSRGAVVSAKDVEILASILLGRGERLYEEIKRIEGLVKELELLVDRLLEDL